MMGSEDEIHVTPDDAPRLHSLFKELGPGAVVNFGPGRYRASLWIEKSVRLRGNGDVRWRLLVPEILSRLVPEILSSLDERSADDLVDSHRCHDGGAAHAG